MPLFMRTRRIMKEKVLTTVVTFETTTQAIAMERECKKNKFTGRLIPVPLTALRREQHRLLHL